ncbi:MAG: dihydropteroate synthase-like protein [Candidatus Hodarchaeota archaeon]
MKVLLVTGKLAEPLVRNALAQTKSSHSIDVIVLPLAVAAFLHPKYVSAQIRLRGQLEKTDLILLPGMISGDTSIVTKATGIPTFKGTQHAADLPLLLESLSEKLSQLSTTQPADIALAEEVKKKARRDLAQAERPPKGQLPRTVLKIGKGKRSILVGPRRPMRVIAEITDAPLRPRDELKRLARHFVASGAHIIDVGMIAEAPNPKAAREIVSILQKEVSVMISIDTLHTEEILAGLEGGADLVLSLDQDNMLDIPKTKRSHPTFTVIPATRESGDLPKSLDERLELLFDNISNARSLGFKKLIADPLCDPLISPGLTRALQAYREFHLREPTVPMLMGVGNVTELIDADSPGVNALLAGIAVELGVSLVLTTEVSPKTHGAVWELYRASQMMYLARRRRAPPKDLGLDLLLLKSKQFPESTLKLFVDAEYPRESITEVRAPHKMDPQGYFTFHVNREQNSLVARHYTTDDRETPSLELSGATAQQLIEGIITRKLVSQLDHAAYIGRELTKAELALITGRPYIQEAPLFRSWRKPPG